MNRILKGIGVLVGVLLVVALVATGVLYVLGGSKLGPPSGLPAESFTVVVDSASIARGEHLAMTHGCVECHAANLGGTLLEDSPPFRLVAPNLTSGRGGVGALLDDAGWERAIRHGVAHDGHALIVMPSEFYTHLADDETNDLIAWLRTRPPADNELPALHVKALGRILLATGGLKAAPALIDESAAHTPGAPPVTATVEYGRYRTGVMCAGCHGEDLNGAPGVIPGSPPAPSLLAASAWTPEQFRTALRTGQTPYRALQVEFMPWNVFANFTDAEIDGIQAYLRGRAAAGQ